jgi:hypothetical protein
MWIAASRRLNKSISLCRIEPLHSTLGHYLLQSTFRRAAIVTIIILEDGCERFSNIDGLNDIRFPKGKIEKTFEKVRSVLVREGLIGH